MTKLLFGIIFCISLLLLANEAYSQLSVSESLPELVREADLVCIGTIDVKPNPDDPDSARLIISQTIKGKASSSSIFVVHWKEAEVPVPLNRGLFFLVGDASSSYWSFVNRFQPAKNLGPVASSSTMSQIMLPFSTVVLTLALALKTSDEEGRVQLLYSLADAELLRKPTAPFYIRLAADLGENGGFQEFFVNKVLPLIAPLDDDSDLRVRVGALKIQAMFQDKTALPVLIRIIESGGNAQSAPEYIDRAANALGDYDTLVTAPAMLHALNSPIQNIRDAALGSLVNTLGRVAMPLLLDRIQNEETKRQRSILWWLFDITGEMNPSTQGSLESHRQEYLVYWQHWKDTHADELARDRARLAALAKN